MLMRLKLVRLSFGLLQHVCFQNDLQSRGVCKVEVVSNGRTLYILLRCWLPVILARPCNAF